MSSSVGLRLALALFLASLAADALAGKRSIRIDNSNNWTTVNIGDAACAGTTANSTLVTALSYTFAGKGNTATENYNTNDYCEVAQPGTLNQIDYFHDDELGLRTLFGSGAGVT